MKRRSDLATSLIPGLLAGLLGGAVSSSELTMAWFGAAAGVLIIGWFIWEQREKKANLPRALAQVWAPGGAETDPPAQDQASHPADAAKRAAIPLHHIEEPKDQNPGPAASTQPPRKEVGGLKIQVTSYQEGQPPTHRRIAAKFQRRAARRRNQ